MADRSSRGLWSSLRAGSEAQSAALVVDTILMAALADGDLTLFELDAVGRALSLHEDLRTLEWPRLLERAAELADDAPLFSETRQRVASALEPARRERALALAAKVASAGEEALGDESRALLHDLAASFGLREKEIEAALAIPADDPIRRGYLRTTFNDPEATDDLTLFELMGAAQGDMLPILAYKLSAVRGAITQRFETAEVLSVGEKTTLGGRRYRTDATITFEHQRWRMRFVAAGEALHPAEPELLTELLFEHPEDNILIGHAGELAPADRAALEERSSDRFVVELLSV